MRSWKPIDCIPESLLCQADRERLTVPCKLQTFVAVDNGGVRSPLGRLAAKAAPLILCSGLPFLLPRKFRFATVVVLLHLRDRFDIAEGVLHANRTRVF